jgi:3-oxoacyl-[acyl-carrier protein] reductase
MSRLDGRRAVVTGATRGIGRAIAARLARDGAQVLITGTNLERAEVAASELAKETGTPVHAAACDVSVEEDVRQLRRNAVELFGEVDVLVNNAAVAARNRVTDIPLQEWERVFAVNVTGTFLAVRELVPLMTGDRANIVNIASQAGKLGEALLVHYSASKAAQINMTKSLALELAPRIRVNAVCPGVIETDMILEHYQVQSVLRGITPEAVRDEIVARTPLARLQTPRSIAAVVAWLVSDDALDMTGQSVNVAGGMVMD